MKQEKLIVIDGNALIHRAFHALPPLTSKDGQLVNAVYGFALILFKIYKELKPDYIALTLDKAKKTFRHEEYKEYKATRTKQPDELYAQIPIVKNLAKAFNIPLYELDGFEADDLIGTICHKTEGKVKSIIVTGDMDTLQLIDDDTEVFTLKRGVNDTVIYDAAAVKERYGLKPYQMIDYKGLRGDASDNIPGVKGIGEKTAVELLREFGTLEKVLAAAKKGDKKIKDRYRALLVEHEEDAKMSKHLATIVLDAPIDFRLNENKVVPPDQKKVFDLFQHLGFKSLLSRLPDISGKAVAETKQGDLFGAPSSQLPAPSADFKIRKGYHLVADEKSYESFIKELKKQDTIAIDTETTSLDTITAKLLGIGFCWKSGEAYYLVFNEQPRAASRELRAVLEDNKVKKIGHNLKYDIEILKQAGFEVGGVYFDTMIASYLLNPGSRAHDLDTLAFTEIGYQMTPITALIGPKGKGQITLEQVDVNRVADYCSEDADYTFQLFEKLYSEVEKKNILGLMEKIEMPLIPILAKMETTGVKIDKKFLDKLDKQLEEDRQKIDKEIYKIAGISFNIDSPLQLKEVLFDRLKISSEGIKKIKTGISTAAPELEKLSGRHKIIDYISDHRELAKLQSTYTRALPELISKKTGRVHTSFNQTVTATGRLSSSDPNLQNIPIRTELGSKIRRAFIAEEGYKILKADYSQIELRIVASLAKDKKMLKIFEEGKDIHQATAAAINDVPLEKVTKEMRRNAKAVNFGILYGMGAYGLSWRTKISVDEARKFIEKYFESFSGVKEYLEETIRLAKAEGYVETLFGRVRYIPDINSGVGQIRAAAERMAINAPIQGTAADLIKLAMIEIDKVIKKEFAPNEVKMVLQVHDELVFEVKDVLVKKVAKLVRDTMENVYKLRVPIVVDVEVGDNWGETERIA
ncbi:MAG: DNA polymerase I [Patescibacteria group bacterium]|jgi:DNA polymerase-1